MHTYYNLILTNFFGYTFFTNAIIIGLLLAVACSLLSPFLVLKNQSLLADGLSHASFLGFTIGSLLLNQPLYLAIPITLTLSLIMHWFIKHIKTDGDTAIGVMQAVGFGGGLLVLSIKGNGNQLLDQLIKGNIFSNSKTDIYLVLSITLIILIFIITFYRRLLQTTFDQEYTITNKYYGSIINYVLTGLTSVLIVIGIRTMGTLLISSLIIFPALIAMQFKLNFIKTLIIGVIISVLSMFLGIILGSYLVIPTSSSVVIFNISFLIISFISFKLFHKIIKK